ncbi:MAG: hypothetical protein WBD53_04985 [Xanthobacteraceae bacterium]
MADIGGVGRLTHLAVGDDVDAAFDLRRDHVVDRPRGRRFEQVGGDGFAVLAAQNEIDQGLRPRQAAGMRGENALGRSFHAGLPAGVVASIRRG